MTSRTNWKAILSITAIILSVILLLSFGIWAINKNNNFLANLPIIGEKEKAETVNVQTVSSETMKALSQGTVLTFGDPEKKHVSLIVDPSEISRDSHIINGEPSDFLNLIKDNEIFLNLFLYPSDETRTTGVDSLFKTATCNLANDKSPGGIVTLVKIVNAAQEFTGNEDINKASEIMNMSPDTECPEGIDSAAMDSKNNGETFMQEFGLSKPEALVSDGQVIDSITNFKTSWVEDIKEGKPASQLLNETVKITNDIQ